MGPETGKRGLECGGTVDTWDQRPESEVWWDCRHVGPETGKRGSVVGLSTGGTRDLKARWCGGTVDRWDQRPESELVWWDCRTHRTRLLLPAVRTNETFSRSDNRHFFQFVSGLSLCRTASLCQSDSTVAMSDNVTPGTLGSTGRLGISVCCLTARTSARSL